MPLAHTFEIRLFKMPKMIKCLTWQCAKKEHRAGLVLEFQSL